MNTGARLLPRDSYLALKSATRRLVAASGGLEALAADPAMRVGRASLSNYQNPDQPAFAPLDVIADLEAAGACSYGTEALCRLAGGVFLPILSGPGRGLNADVAALAKEIAEVFGAHAAALADGRVSCREMQAMLRQLDEALAAAAQVRATVIGRLVELDGAARERAAEARR